MAALHHHRVLIFVHTESTRTRNTYCIQSGIRYDLPWLAGHRYSTPVSYGHHNAYELPKLININKGKKGGFNGILKWSGSATVKCYHSAIPIYRK